MKIDIDNADQLGFALTPMQREWRARIDRWWASEPACLEGRKLNTIRRLSKHGAKLRHSFAERGLVPFQPLGDSRQVRVAGCRIGGQTLQIVIECGLADNETRLAPFSALTCSKQQVDGTITDHDLSHLYRGLVQKVRRAAKRVWVNGPFR